MKTCVEVSVDNTIGITIDNQDGYLDFSRWLEEGFSQITVKIMPYMVIIYRNGRRQFAIPKKFSWEWLKGRVQFMEDNGL